MDYIAGKTYKTVGGWEATVVEVDGTSVPILAIHKNDQHLRVWHNPDGSTFTSVSKNGMLTTPDFDLTRSAIVPPTLADALALPAIKAMVDAAEYLKTDMIQRAEAGIDVISGEQYRVVNAGNGAWMGFCDALAALTEKE